MIWSGILHLYKYKFIIFVFLCRSFSVYLCWKGIFVGSDEYIFYYKNILLLNNWAATASFHALTIKWNFLFYILSVSWFCLIKMVLLSNRKEGLVNETMIVILCIMYLNESINKSILQSIAWTNTVCSINNT